MDEGAIQSLLAPFRVHLDNDQLISVATYLELLLRWNRAVNLTAVREPEQIVVRHFAESMYLSLYRRVEGTFLDVGSGAGFPGLALKILEPESLAILLEPVAKKRAFLKEVVRQCRLDRVDVRGERVEEFCRGAAPAINTMTARAVGAFENILLSALRCLSGDAQLCLWLTQSEGSKLLSDRADLIKCFRWLPPIKLPLSRQREIWRATVVSRETSQIRRSLA